MNLPNFKDVLQKFSVFKNTALLIPVVIGLISVLLFVPTKLMSNGLKKKVQTESIDKGLTPLKRLRDKGVSDQLLAQKTQQLQIRMNDANEIQRLAVQTTQRQLLSDMIFDVNDPNSLSPLVFSQFGRDYRAGIDRLTANAKIAVAGRAGDCPTQAELTRALEDAGANSRSRLGAGQGRSPYETGRNITTVPPSRAQLGRGNPMGGMRMMSEIERVLVDQLCRKRAEEISFYVTPTELSGYAFWEKYDINIKKAEAVEDCWYSQLAYWVIEDIFNTITTMNAEYDNVLNAPVKRLMRLNFTMDTSRGGMGFGRGSRGRVGQTTTEKKDLPKYVLSSEKETMLSEPCTGRYSGDEMDVIHFNVVCVVSTRDFMPFIQELCSAKEHKYIDESGREQVYKHNQITILETRLTSVSKEDTLEHNYYNYGDGGVVELDLMCEYIFNKAGYEEIKPESVKITLLGEKAA